MPLFDGCMYGLKTVSGSVAGRPINKPSKIACNNGFFDHVCDGSLHDKCDHTPCAGSNTRDTPMYTQDICRLIHESIRYDISHAVPIVHPSKVSGKICS